MTDSSYDAIIIGGGPAGYYCALEIGRLGGKTMLIEKDALGGTCTNRGCIPTKTLLHSARIMEMLRAAARRGITVEELAVDAEKMADHRDRIVRTMVKAQESELRKHHGELVNGTGEIVSPQEVRVGQQIYRAKHLVIATGSEPVRLFGGEGVLSSAQFLSLREIPGRLVVIGGGLIGCELAQLFRLLGSEVTIVELMQRCIQDFDPDISSALEKHLKGLGIGLIKGVKPFMKEAKIFVGDREIEADIVLLAAGRKPSLPQQTLDVIGVSCNNKGIETNNRMETTAVGVYAAGDVTGRYQLAHVARYGGEVAARNIMGKDDTADFRAVPRCVYTIPEIASVGMGEQGCDQPEKYLVLKAPFAANPKARCMDRLTGFIKIIAERESRRITGVHIFGEGATELITEATLMIRTGATFRDMKGIMHPHPSLSELYADVFAEIEW
jgi:dihydrolipoamide dehydrogenase